MQEKHAAFCNLQYIASRLLMSARDVSQTHLEARSLIHLLWVASLRACMTSTNSREIVFMRLLPALVDFKMRSTVAATLLTLERLANAS